MAKKKKQDTDWIRIRGASTHNLKDIDVDIDDPLALVELEYASGHGPSSVLVISRIGG